MISASSGVVIDNDEEDVDEDEEEDEEEEEEEEDDFVSVVSLFSPAECVVVSFFDSSDSIFLENMYARTD